MEFSSKKWKKRRTQRRKDAATERRATLFANSELRIPNQLLRLESRSVACRFVSIRRSFFGFQN